MKHSKSPFTVKIFKNHGKSYIGVWRKERRGFYSVIKKDKRHTKAQVIADLRKAETIQTIKEEEPLFLFRVIKAKIYYYNEHDKVGQIRVIVYTYRPDSFNPKVMSKLLIEAEKQAMIRLRGFKEAIKEYVRKVLVTATETRDINFDEYKRSKKKIEKPYVEVAGLGFKYGGVGFYLYE